MNWFKKFYARLQKTVKYSASDPHNFDEIWSFQSTAVRLISLILVVLIVVAVLSAYLFSGTFDRITGNASIERSRLEEQKVTIDELNAKVRAQEMYIENIRMILSGEIPMKIEEDTIVDVHEVDLNNRDLRKTPSEARLSKEVRADISTPSGTKDASLTYFGSPVVGVVSQKFDAKNHPGIDVVTTENTTVKACLGGTVIYSGYSRKDGYILIISHASDFISVYKHNKNLLKKVGTRVQLGDPIAVVGNTGENTDGPHLHFELWYHQAPVNPATYIKFTR